MKPKIIALNLVLAICLGGVIWEAKVQWNQAQSKRQKNLNVAVKPVAPSPLTPASKPVAPSPASYLDVATRDLFSKDRNPTVVIEPPKEEKVKPMPPLPVVYGVMGLPSGTKAIMAEKAGMNSRSVRAGDTVGEFKIIALDTQNVTFDWDGKSISKKIDDLIDRSNATAATGPAPAAQVASAATAAPAQQTQQIDNKPSARQLGVEVGGAGQSQRACRPDDPSPAGAIVDGYQKSVQATPFGNLCRWIPVK